MMLYQVREVQRAFMDPISGWANMMSQLYSNPHSPFSYLPMATRVAAAFELIHRLGKEYEKPAFGITEVTVDGRVLPVAETVETTRPFCRLLRFRRQDPPGTQVQLPVVLVVAPLSGHHATLLRDTVRQMVQDHDVYITDWIDARMVPLSQGPFHLHDYVGYVIGFLRHLGPRVHVVSVCQPTVPVMAAVSIMCTLKDPARPLSMTMMGGPIDPRQSPTQVNLLATDRPYSWFERTVIHRVPGKYPGAGRPVYPGFLQHAGFVSMNPDRHAQSHWDFYLNLMRGDMEDAESHRRFYNEYNAVLDLPAEFYLETIKTVFQDFALPTGTWVVPFEGRDIRVAPEDITDVALLTVEGELDDISGVGQTKAAHGLCRNLPKSLQKDFLVKGAGHYGIFSGRRWREMVYPTISAFIHAAEQRPARSAGSKQLAAAVPDSLAAPEPVTAPEQVTAPETATAPRSVAGPDAGNATDAVTAPAAPAARRTPRAQAPQTTQAAKPAKAAKTAKAAAEPTPAASTPAAASPASAATTARTATRAARPARTRRPT